MGDFWEAGSFDAHGVAYVEGPLSNIPRYINRSGLPCLPKIPTILPGEDLFAFRDKKTDQYGYKNIIGQTVIPAQFIYAYDFSHGLGRVNMGGKYGYINSEGQIKISCTYDYAKDFSCGMAVVQIADKYGYINENGVLKVPCIYDYAEDFSCGPGKVRMGEGWGYVNSDGKLQIPCIYDYALPFTDTDSTVT